MTFFNKIKHVFGRHSYFKVKDFSPHSRKIGCRLCNKTWAMNDSVQSLIEWGSDFQKIYEGENKI
jgi:hypothetical protein